MADDLRPEATAGQKGCGCLLGFVFGVLLVVLPFGCYILGRMDGNRW
jgi:hypothetical protein